MYVTAKCTRTMQNLFNERCSPKNAQHQRKSEQSIICRKKPSKLLYILIYALILSLCRLKHLLDSLNAFETIGFVHAMSFVKNVSTFQEAHGQSDVNLKKSTQKNKESHVKRTTIFVSTIFVFLFLFFILTIFLTFLSFFQFFQSDLVSLRLFSYQQIQASSLSPALSFTNSLFFCWNVI